MNRNAVDVKKTLLLFVSANKTGVFGYFVSLVCFVDGSLYKPQPIPKLHEARVENSSLKC